MVAVTKTWLAGIGVRLGGHGDDAAVGPLQAENPRSLGVLAFEAARAISRLVSLYRALSDAEVARLRSDVMRAEGVAYLVSTDQTFLLRLACAEIANDLDRAAATASRFSRRCRAGVWPRGFDHVYDELKSGSGDISRLGLGVQPKDVEKKVRKMERYVKSTSALYQALDKLAEMDAEMQRKQGKWKNIHYENDPDRELLQKQIQHLREESLWGKSFDKVAELMACGVVTVFARICAIFGPFVMEIPSVAADRHGRVRFVLHHRSPVCPHNHHYNPHLPGIYSSGPLERYVPGIPILSNSGPILRYPAKTEAKAWKNQVLAAAPRTVGGSALDRQYAKVIVLLEQYLMVPEVVGKEQREELYEMLSLDLRAAVRSKLRHSWKMDSSGGRSDGLLAEGWKDAAERILAWLAPVAHDTIRWHDYRIPDRRLETAPRVLALQTLFFTDKEKTEAAVVEVLVALSCICRYQQSEEEEEFC